MDWVYTLVHTDSQSSIYVSVPWSLRGYRNPSPLPLNHLIQQCWECRSNYPAFQTVKPRVCFQSVFNIFNSCSNLWYNTMHEYCTGGVFVFFHREVRVQAQTISPGAGTLRTPCGPLMGLNPGSLVSWNGIWETCHNTFCVFRTSFIATLFQVEEVVKGGSNKHRIFTWETSVYVKLKR